MGDWVSPPPKKTGGAWALIGNVVLWTLFIAFWVFAAAMVTTWLILKFLVLVTALILQFFLIPFRW